MHWHLWLQTDRSTRNIARIFISIGMQSVSPETYAHAVKLFGERDALDLAYLMEEYAETCGILTVFNQQLPPGQKPLLPIP